MPDDLRLVPRALGGSRAPEISPTVFVLLRDLIAERTGVHFDDTKRDLLADKLADMLSSHGLGSYLDYYYMLRYDDPDGAHWAALADRLAVPETFFWRQAEHFEALSRVIAPAYFAANANRPLRIWSAACCTGEEPVSVAIALAEAGLLSEGRVSIVASDASPAMVERARAGIYGTRSFRQLPEALRDKYFRQMPDGRWMAAERLRSRIDWRVANLMRSRETAAFESSDVIFCRNVFIYFSDDAIRDVASRFAANMPEHGHLFLGASESLTRLGVDLELAEIGGAFVYVKRRSAS